MWEAITLIGGTPGLAGLGGGLMKKLIIGSIAASILGASFITTIPAKAATLDDVMAKLNALEKENADLRQRVKTLENRKTTVTGASTSKSNTPPSQGSVAIVPTAGALYNMAAKAPAPLA